MQISVIGLDIAKQVFQVHAADAAGRTVAQIKLRRAQVLDYFRALPPCLVGLEACATAHYWARELSAFGHTVRLMPPAYVKPYVKRNKTDAADAQARAEALTRPTMRFVPVKSADQQAMLMLHRTRELLVRQGAPSPARASAAGRAAVALHGQQAAPVGKARPGPQIPRDRVLPGRRPGARSVLRFRVEPGRGAGLRA